MLISNWFYGLVPNDPVRYEENKSLQVYQKLGRWGYDQIPTSSTFGANVLSSKDTMRFFRDEVDMTTTLGFMTSPWFATMPKYKYALLNDAFVFGKAKEAIFPDEY